MTRTAPDTAALLSRIRVLGRGWSVSNLTLMRWFYLACRDRIPISQTPPAIPLPPEAR